MLRSPFLESSPRDWIRGQLRIERRSAGNDREFVGRRRHVLDQRRRHVNGRALARSGGHEEHRGRTNDDEQDYDKDR